jgi:putative tricarboxylic transport membrane protein
MLGSLIDGLMLILQWNALLYMLIGVAIGFWVGILPGIGGGTTIALMLPFIYKMTPSEGIPFLLGMHSVVATTGDITSVLFGIPGEPTTVATIMDGYPMSKKGEAGRALGAALMSSLIGALIGAVVLALTIPVVRPLVMLLKSPEMLMIIVIGLTCIASLSSKGKRGIILGMLAGGIGFLCSMVGESPQTGILRFTFGALYLFNGLPLVPVMIGIFAIPEIIDLKVRGTAIAGDLPPGKLGKGVMEGIRDTFRYFWLTVRCSLIGCWIGFVPGLGGAVAQWMSYAHAVQSAKTPEERAGFGKGDVRGVLGPGAANNSKEGAALVPTIVFGVPTSPGMAILLAGFIVLGLIPGPEMITKHLPLVFSMVWTIALANIICVAASLLFINHLAKLTTVRGSLLIPVILFLCFIGAYGTDNRIGDVVVMAIFGGLGYLMLQIGLPRPPFIIGFVLGNLAETCFGRSMAIYGFKWLYRPGVIILLCLAISIPLLPVLLKKIRRDGEINEI